MATATPSRLSAPSATSPPSALSTAAEDGDGLVQSLTPLLEAPTLCWELHAAHCPLWTRVEELAREAAAGEVDEWAVVEQPWWSTVPPPDATPEEIAEYEAALLRHATARAAIPVD